MFPIICQFFVYSLCGIFPGIARDRNKEDTKNWQRIHHQKHSEPTNTQRITWKTKNTHRITWNFPEFALICLFPTVVRTSFFVMHFLIWILCQFFVFITFWLEFFVLFVLSLCILCSEFFVSLYSLCANSSLRHSSWTTGNFNRYLCPRQLGSHTL